MIRKKQSLLFVENNLIGMESQLTRPYGHRDYEPETQGGGMHEHGETHEKKSVMKKVKAKAKKIKDTIKKAGHHGGHEHEHDHGHYDDSEDRRVPDDHDLDEEDEDEYEETLQGPEVHGAPMYESTTSGFNSGRPAASLGKTKTMDDPLPPKGRTEINTATHQGQQGIDPLASKERVSFNPGNHPSQLDSGQPHVTFGKTMVMGEDPHSLSEGVHQSKGSEPSRTFVETGEGLGQRKVNLDRPRGLVEDPAAPNPSPVAHGTSDYRPSVNDPTAKGGEQVGMAPIHDSFGKMSVGDEPVQKQSSEARDRYSSLASTGSHDQFSPELAPPKQHDIAESFQALPESFEPKVKDQYPHDVRGKQSNLSSYTPISENLQAGSETYGGEQHNQSSYTDKISCAATGIAGTAVAAKNAVASKLGLGGQDDAAEYAEKMGARKPEGKGEEKPGVISSATSAISDKAISSKDVVASKLGYGGDKEEGEDYVMQRGRGKSETLGSDTHSPDDRDHETKNGSYTGKITSAAAAIPSAITGTAVSAKDAVASKLGYDTHKEETEEGKNKELNKPAGKVTESEEVARRLGRDDDRYGQKVRSSYEDARGGSVMDKVTGVVTSLFSGGPVDSEKPQDSAGHPRDTAGERRLQESGN